MGAELCAFNCGPYCAANSVSLSLQELLASVMLLKCELCHHCCRCELYCWIVIAGVCWTVLLALAWRYVSNAPMLLRTLLLQAFHKPSLTSHKAYHQPWLWSQSAIIEKLDRQPYQQLDFLCSVNLTRGCLQRSHQRISSPAKSVFEVKTWVICKVFMTRYTNSSEHRNWCEQYVEGILHSNPKTL